MTNDKPDTLQIFNPSDLSVTLNNEKAERVLELIQHEESCNFELIELVYVDEDEIIITNQKYLGKGYVTDIITFRYDQDELLGAIEGTIYCCAPRIIEQAEEFSQSLESEFLRIFVHGLLHLTGYEDDTEENKKIMREREDFYLSKLL